MRSAHSLWLVAPLLASLFEPNQAPPIDGTSGESDEHSCMLCHSGPTKGLRRSAHAFLIERQPTSACRICHRGSEPHRDSARRAEDARVPAGSVVAAACANCHQGRGYIPGAASHPWRRESEIGLPIAVSDDSSDFQLPPNAFEKKFEWAGLIALGLRLIDVNGSRDRFDTDFNLDRGLRLSEIGLRGNGSGDYLDHIEFGAENLGDPYEVIHGTLGRSGRYESNGRWRQSRYRYRGGGDFHRVDRKDQETGADVSFDLNDQIKLDADFTRRSQEGFWLTNRIGNQNLVPLTTVDGVRSPRRFDSDDFRVGLSGNLQATAFSLGVSYRDESQRNRWIFSRPAQANPAFVESDDFSSQSTLRGPGLDFSLSREMGPLSLDLHGSYLNLDRRIRGRGDLRGFDVAEFSTATNSQTKGNSQSIFLDGQTLLAIGESTDLIFAWHYLNHDEHLAIAQTEITAFPSLGSSTTIGTNLDQRTSQRVFDGSVEIEQELHKSLVVNLGYGFSRESLRLPDLENGDNDFLSGRLENDGLIAGLEWRPDEHWTLSGRYTDYGQNSLQLHELAEDDASRVDGKLRYQGSGYWAELFATHRRSTNDASSHRFQSNSFGISTSLQPRDDIDLFANFTYTAIDSRTLTNFFFDPDPNPRPSVVGFMGDTQSFNWGFRIEPSERMHLKADANYTDTRGNFDVSLLDWRVELGIKATPRNELGLQFRQVDYEEQAGRDNFDASILVFYWRLTFGNWR